MIFYIYVYGFTGLHRKVISGIGAVELVVWGVWAALTSHPSKWKLRAFFVSSILTMCLRMLDFQPYKGYVDAHALWRAAGIPLSYLWWSFVCDDAVFRTTVLLKKSKWWRNKKWFKGSLFFLIIFFFPARFSGVQKVVFFRLCFRRRRQMFLSSSVVDLVSVLVSSVVFFLCVFFLGSFSFFSHGFVGRRVLPSGRNWPLMITTLFAFVHFTMTTLKNPFQFFLM